MKTIVLAGNGPYLNRGCEAIVRGTVEILTEAFGDDCQFFNHSFGDASVVNRQQDEETDARIRHVALADSPGCLARFNGQYFYERLWGHQFVIPFLKNAYRYCPVFNVHKKAIQSAAVCLEIGGDNYTFDYGFPMRFFCLDDHLKAMNQSAPLILWGASLGDYSKRNQKEQKVMTNRLAQFDHIFVREHESHEWLRSRGLNRLTLMGDPAFVMQPMEPDWTKAMFIMPQDALGINLSPLIGKYIYPSREKWLAKAREIVESLASGFKCNLLFIPHVTASLSETDDTVIKNTDDWVFLDDLRNSLSPDIRSRTALVPKNLNAAELKWIISQCKVFIGARTHSTIAALSSFVPTLSLAYSLKARGINKDIFGHLEYCIGLNEATPQTLCKTINTMISDDIKIREHLKLKIPEIQQRAYEAGQTLKRLISRVGNNAKS